MSLDQPTSPELLLRIERVMRWRDRSNALLATFMLICGMPLLALGPAIVASVAWLGGGMNEWLRTFWGSAAILLPLMFLLEWRTQGNFATDAAMGMSDSGYTGATYGSRKGAYVLLFVVLGMLGPGLIVGALRRFRSLAVHRSVDRSRAAQIVQQLMLVKGGVDVSQLAGSPEQFMELSPTFAYLTARDWIGFAKDGSKAWLLSETRNRLAGGVA